MKKIIIICITALCCQPLLWGQQKYPNAGIGPEGIYINCGNEIPRNFAYQIHRRVQGTKVWEEKALISAENNFDRFFNKVWEANAHNPAYKFPADSVKMMIWESISRYGNVDAIPTFGVLPMYREALGVTWYDHTAEKGKLYEYKVVTLKAGQKPVERIVPAVKYPPAKKLNYRIKTLEKDANEQRVNLIYRIEDAQNMFAAKLFRSYYLQSDFAPLTELVGFFENDNGSYGAIAVDKSVIKKGIVLYYLQPYDIYGNPGYTSDTIRITNIVNESETVLEGLVATGLDDGIRVSWRFEKPEYLRSIDIFKKSELEAEEKYVISVSPKDTCFIDYDVEPNLIYNYKVVINNAYGKSPQSTSVTGWFDGSSKASAPHGLTAEVRDGIVELQWHKPDDDTKAYHVFRADGGNTEFRQIGDVQNSDNVLITYIDSVDNVNSSLLAYAVKSENTSRAVSPLSEVVQVTPKRNIMLSPPLNINSTYIDKIIRVRWEPVDGGDKNVMGYRVERRRVIPQLGDLQLEEFVTVSTSDHNYFEDKSVSEGATYEYRVLSQGLNGVESFPSIISTCYVPAVKPVSIRSLQVLKTIGGYQLVWEKTGQKNVNSYNVYRVQENKPPKLLTTLKIDQTSYFDKIKPDNTIYLYTVTCVGNNNIESEIINWMGAN